MGASGNPPALAVLADPVEQGSLKADVVTETLGLQPLVSQYFFPLS